MTAQFFSSLHFANPVGFFALLGIPAILAIHLLHRQSRRLPTSTLFLFETLPPVSAHGRRIDRLRNSAPLWFQLLAVLLVTWLLVQPRWLRADSAQQVTVVLDSSVSMDAFRTRMLDALRNRFGEISAAANRTRWTLLESDPSRPTLYSGNNLSALLEAAAKWTPALGHHDVTRTLQSLRSLNPPPASLIFVTDRPQAVPEGVDLLSAGEPIENCGFSGLKADADTWTALVTNSGTAPRSLKWWVEAPGHQPTAPESIALAPGQSASLHGRFSTDELTVVLEADRFTADDRLPVVRPKPKPLNLSIQPQSALDPFFQRLAASIPDSKSGATPSDLRLATHDPLAPAPLPERAIVFVAEPGQSKKFLTGEILAEPHPLTTDLNWQGLLVKNSLRIPSKPGDEVLLWQGDRPLIFLRGEAASRSLVVNFDLRQSNADRLPAFVLLLHRFAETLRSRKIAPESANFETSQRLNIARDPGSPQPVVVPDSAPPAAGLRAPVRPDFFRVRQAGTDLLRGAARFADPRESDFREAAPADSLTGKTSQLVERNSLADPFRPLAALVLAATLLASWATARKLEKPNRMHVAADRS